MYTKAQKKAILNWRKKNPEKYNKYHNEKGKEYYKSNAEVLRQKRMDRYYFVKENNYDEICKVFRKILL